MQRCHAQVNRLCVLFYILALQELLPVQVVNQPAQLHHCQEHIHGTGDITRHQRVYLHIVGCGELAQRFQIPSLVFVIQ